MKKTLNILLLSLVFYTAAFGQNKTSDDATLEAIIKDLDKSGWEAWKNKDAEWFKTNTTEEFVSINSDGISDKAQVVNSTPVDCNVNSYSLNNFKFVVLNENTVLLTYTALQDGECGGNKLNAEVRASAIYVKRNGQWLEALYMETPVTK